MIGTVGISIERMFPRTKTRPHSPTGRSTTGTLLPPESRSHPSSSMIKNADVILQRRPHLWHLDLFSRNAPYCPYLFIFHQEALAIRGESEAGDVVRLVHQLLGQCVSHHIPQVRVPSVGVDAIICSSRRRRGDRPSGCDWSSSAPGTTNTACRCPRMVVWMRRVKHFRLD